MAFSFGSKVTTSTAQFNFTTAGASTSSENQNIPKPFTFGYNRSSCYSLDSESSLPNGTFFGAAKSTSNQQHAVSILESLAKLWKEEVVCDFVIKVGEELFPVHRALLIASSDYFRAMLVISKMKEGKEGVVDMKGVEAKAVKCCLEYIYSGNTKITEDNVVEILQAASIMQLEKLRVACFDFLKNNLCVETCILTLEVAKLHDHVELTNLAQEFFTAYFSSVTNSATFCELTKDDALKYILEFGATDDTNWQASRNWIEHELEIRDDEVLDFFNMLDLTEFPSSHFLSSTWKIEYFRKCEMCLDRLYHRVFSNVLELSENINIDNCYVLNEMADSYEHAVQEIPSLIFGFMLKKFARISSMKEFETLPERDIVSLFQSSHAVYVSSEKIKWFAALKWIKTNPAKRTNVFKVLVRTIAFDRMPKEFIHESVREEPLMQKFPECQQLLLDAAFSNPANRTQENFVAILDTNNCVDVFEMNKRKWHPLHYTPKTFNVKIASLNGHLCLLEGKELSIARSGKLIKMASMSQEPSAAAQIAASGERIYVLENGQKFSYYDSMVDSWTEGLPLKQVDSDDFVTVSTNTGLCLLYSLSDAPIVFGLSREDTFERMSVPSSMGVKINRHASAAYCSSSIFVSAIQSRSHLPAIARYCLTEKTWKKIRIPSHSTRGKNICISTVDNKLVSYTTNSSNELDLEFYNDHWNEWTPFQNRPQFRSQGISKRIRSLCSFSMQT